MLLFISALGTASDLTDNPGYIPTIFKGADRARGKTSPKKREANTSSRTPQFVPPTPTKTPRGRKRKIAEPPTTPTSASGRPIKSRRLHAQLYVTDCQPPQRLHLVAPLSQGGCMPSSTSLIANRVLITIT